MAFSSSPPVWYAEKQRDWHVITRYHPISCREDTWSTPLWTVPSGALCCDRL